MPFLTTYMMRKAIKGRGQAGRRGNYNNSVMRRWVLKFDARKVPPASTTAEAIRTPAHLCALEAVLEVEGDGVGVPLCHCQPHHTCPEAAARSDKQHRVARGDGHHLWTAEQSSTV